ncbi:hypothetical protein Phum_PHUM200830 [Pediculus humanus corporis]|uniref:Uncharacterized protein n=1 Tax=Pediculus humanus subsp. corporis TaxID=121224 RepID=E0VH44_PEDHC|nr:uncharacterized protein Phum_PHUM200830 [Pediculus humanus corporis]EEB12700.1 hypothetical protein Phum_PHUM200830 [Pediculus humanus corporis]
MGHESSPSLIPNKDYWFLYSIGTPDNFKCGLLFVQTDNLITLLTDMSNLTNYTYGFCLEDTKWMIFYLTIFLLCLLEIFSVVEIFDLFLGMWMYDAKFDVTEKPNIETTKEFVSLIDTLSKCSWESVSKFSSRTAANIDIQSGTEPEIKSSVKFSNTDNKKIFDSNEPVVSLSKGDNVENTQEEPDAFLDDSEAFGFSQVSSEMLNLSVDIPSIHSGQLQLNTTQSNT